MSHSCGILHAAYMHAEEGAQTGSYTNAEAEVLADAASDQFACFVIAFLVNAVKVQLHGIGLVPRSSVRKPCMML